MLTVFIGWPSVSIVWHIPYNSDPANFRSVKCTRSNLLQLILIFQRLINYKNNVYYPTTRPCVALGECYQSCFINRCEILYKVLNLVICQIIIQLTLKGGMGPNGNDVCIACKGMRTRISQWQKNVLKYFLSYKFTEANSWIC